jgi:DNA-binding GntR family transcriptional regulator
MSGYEPETAADLIHQEMREQIWAGNFLPGDRVSIRALAHSRGSSVIPVRDAVRRLVAEGALCFIDSRTIEVPRLNLTNHRDVLFSRLKLEPELALRAYEHLSQTDLDALVVLDGAVNQAIATGDLALYMRSNLAFHFQIYRRAGSPTLLRLVELLWLQYGPSMRYIAAQYGAQELADDYHRAATDALTHRRRDAFVAAIEADIAQGMELILAASRHLAV